MRAGSSKLATVIKLLNQRCFLRWSPNCATHAVFPPIELGDESAPGLLEAFERVSHHWLAVVLVRRRLPRWLVRGLLAMVRTTASNLTWQPAWRGK